MSIFSRKGLRNLYIYIYMLIALIITFISVVNCDYKYYIDMYVLTYLIVFIGNENKCNV